MASLQNTPGSASAPYTWYLLRIAPGTAHPYQLNKLSIKLPVNVPNGFAYALSPDDRELAVESEGYFSNSAARITLGIYSVSSGAELRAWSTSRFATGPGQLTLSWLSDGRQLAFSALPPGHGLQYQLRTLDVTGSGTDLMAASHALLTVPLTGASTCDSLHITPDGGTVICAEQYALLIGAAGTDAGCANGGLELTAYAVRTGKPVRVLYRYRGACHNGISTVQWTDASATEIIGATEINVDNEGGKQTGQLGVITDGHIRLLKLPKSVYQTDYGMVAF